MKGKSTFVGEIVAHLLQKYFYLYTNVTMPQLDASGRHLLDTLRNSLIPWASDAAPFVLLGAPPRVIGSIRVTEQPGKKLPVLRGRGQKVRVQLWREENLNSMTMPYLGCVVDGEADIVSGVTTSMCRKFNIPGKSWIINAPAKTFLMTPPEVPLSSGFRPHWERAHPEKAYSRILWMQFQTTGACCHFCTSSKGGHWSHPDFFIQSAEFYPLAQKLIHEMTNQPPQYLPLVYYHLSALLHYMVRALLSKPYASGESVSMISPHIDRVDNIVQQAISFINTNFNEHTLTVGQVAAHLHISPRHLARLFQQETGTPVITFVFERRMELACDLLAHSEFNIGKVGGLCGYASSSSFVKAFFRHFGVSPTEYRVSQKK